MVKEEGCQGRSKMSYRNAVVAKGSSFSAYLILHSGSFNWVLAKSLFDLDLRSCSRLFADQISEWSRWCRSWNFDSSCLWTCKVPKNCNFHGLYFLLELAVAIVDIAKISKRNCTGCWSARWCSAARPHHHHLSHHWPAIPAQTLVSKSNPYITPAYSD